MKKVPYGQTFKLSKAVEAACWNFTTDQRFTLPVGTLVKLEHVSSPTETTVMVVDEDGNTPGIELEYVPRYFAHIPSTHDRTPVKQLGYRFIIDNQVLGDAIGVKMPKRTQDLVGEIMRYESGEATAKQKDKLFRKLKRTGIGSKLQGHYSSKM